MHDEDNMFVSFILSTLKIFVWILRKSICENRKRKKPEHLISILICISIQLIWCKCFMRDLS